MAEKAVKSAEAKPADKSSAGITGTQESGTSHAPLPSEVTPTAAEYRKAEEQLQADDDARREAHGDFAAKQLRERDEHWTEDAKRVKRPDEFLPEDKVNVVLPEGHPNREAE